MNISELPPAGRNQRGKRWRLRWQVTDLAGRVRTVNETFRGTRQDAERRWIERQRELAAGGWDAERITVAEFARRWLEARRARVQPSTWESYERMIRTHIVPALGGIRLADLKPWHVQQMIDGILARGRSARTAAYARDIARTLLNSAVRMELLARNPAAATDPPAGSRDRTEALTPEEVVRLLAAARGTQVQHLLALAAFTGMRRGELLGLRWEDVDLDRRQITVRRARVAVRGAGGAYEKEPKTRAGVRRVALSDPAVAALLARRAQQDADRERAGAAWQDRVGMVFTTQLGRPLRPDRVTRDMRRIARKAGLSVTRLHALRHTEASVELAAGVPVEVVSKRLGHRHISTTLDLYADLLDTANRQAAEQLSRFWADRLAALDWLGSPEARNGAPSRAREGGGLAESWVPGGGMDHASPSAKAHPAGRAGGRGH